MYFRRNTPVLLSHTARIGDQTAAVVDPRVGPRIRRSLARKGQGWSASDDDLTLIEARVTIV